MTDKEIIKAFEICYTDGEEGCETCPLRDEEGFCMDVPHSTLLNDTLDLINRQKAEIEGLKNSVETLSQKVAKARNGTVDEFAERFIRSISGCFHCVNMKIIRAKINTVAEQMKNEK